jgi:TonB family protein
MVRDWKQWEGRVVNNTFPLRQCLGGSEQSVVFLTERRGREPQKAAIKLITVDPANTATQLARWEFAAKLSHPHLLRLFETGSCQLDGLVLLYVVMEYAEENLAQILPQRALTPEEVRDMLGPTLDLLAYLHGHSLVHGRLKPSNILATHDQLKLSSDSLIRAGEPIRPDAKASLYDAPEIANGILLPASDIWSLGMTLMETLTQRLPACEGMAEPVPETVPAPFMGIAHCCLRRDPHRRCTVADIAGRLRSSAGSSLSLSPSSPTAQKASTLRIPAASAKWRYILPVAGVGLLGAALLIGPKLLNRQPEPQPVSSVSPVSPQLSTEQSPAQVPDLPHTTANAQTAHAAAETKPSPQKAVKRNQAASAVTPAPEAAPPIIDRSDGPSAQGKVLQQVAPAVSKSARDTITGTLRVTVKLEVDSSGNVARATFISAGPSKYFSRQAMQAAQQWKFAPAQVNGKAAPSTWILHFGFRRSGTEVVPQEGKS